MAMSGVFSRTQLLLTGALLLSVGLSVWTYWQEHEAEQSQDVAAIASVPTGDASMSEAIPTAPISLPLGLVARNRTSVMLDPFAPLAVIEPPKPKTPAPPRVVEVPKAPPLPFQYMGKLVDAETSLSSNGTSSATTLKKVVVYLVRGNETFSVSPGDAIDTSYQFVALEGDTLVFKYIPLSERQTLTIGQMP